MTRITTVLISAAAGFALAVVVLDLDIPHTARAGGAPCSAQNGDVNADAKVDLSDAVTILGNLFLGNPTGLAPLCDAPAGAVGLPTTGQSTCTIHDAAQGLWVPVPCDDAACKGQDGFYAAGCPPEDRFVDNDDSTVTDTCTGLMWQKETADTNNDGQVDALSDTRAWCEAIEYCEELEFAGHSDWRLPNIRELQSIVDYGRNNPAVDPAFGALLQYYWSSTSYMESPNEAWGIGFHVGYVGIRTKTGDFEFSYNYIRAVRGGS